MKIFPLTLTFTVTILLLMGHATVAGESKLGTCYVCRYNNDLPCVQVHVIDTTPRMIYQGRTYYFCSKNCLKDFAKNPKKYLPKTS